MASATFIHANVGEMESRISRIELSQCWMRLQNFLWNIGYQHQISHWKTEFLHRAGEIFGKSEPDKVLVRENEKRTLDWQVGNRE